MRYIWVSFTTILCIHISACDDGEACREFAPESEAFAACMAADPDEQPSMRSDPETIPDDVRCKPSLSSIATPDPDTIPEWCRPISSPSGQTPNDPLESSAVEQVL